MHKLRPLKEITSAKVIFLSTVRAPTASSSTFEFINFICDLAECYYVKIQHVVNVLYFEFPQKYMVLCIFEKTEYARKKNTFINTNKYTTTNLNNELASNWLTIILQF